MDVLWISIVVVLVLLSIALMGVCDPPETHP
jgi:hypothetical protein